MTYNPLERKIKILPKNYNTEPSLLTFSNGAGVEIGRLVIKEGKIDFFGNASESAKILFNELAAILKDFKNVED